VDTARQYSRALKRNFVSRSSASLLMNRRDRYLSALYVILAPVNRGLALAGALFRLVFAMLWLIAAAE